MAFAAIAPLTFAARCAGYEHDEVASVTVVPHISVRNLYFAVGTQMPSSDAFALRRSGLNEFLFAAIGTEGNGMVLSVLSVFARLGHDPWKEAGRLAGLPKLEAVESLARTITSMPTSLWTLPAAREIATRLIALLPMQLPVAGHDPLTSAYSAQTRRFIGMGVVFVCVAFAVAYEAGTFTTTDAAKPPASDTTRVVTPHP